MTHTKIMHTSFGNSIATFRVLARLMKGPESRKDLLAAVATDLAKVDGIGENGLEDLTRVVAAAVAIAEDVGDIDRLRGQRLQITDEGAEMAEKFFLCTQP